MDYDNDNENGRSKQWGWQGEDCSFQKNSNYDITEGLWSGVPQNEEDISYMFDNETTPVKACGDLAYHICHDNTSKGAKECREESFSQMKRRRMLQFPNEDMDSSLCSVEMSSAFVKSNETVDSLEEGLPEGSHWNSGFSENTSASGYDTLDQSPEGWIMECFNDAEMHCSPDTMNHSETSDFQIDISDFCKTAPEYANNLPQQHISTPQKIIFKGRKSYIRTPTKLATSVAYPFAFIKPSGAHGDVTLKDINQRIRTPPPKSKQKNEDPSVAYPTSAFSGKPVVGKTKIRTEGGKGSITIMRTKG